MYGSAVGFCGLRDEQLLPRSGKNKYVRPGTPRSVHQTSVSVIDISSNIHNRHTLNILFYSDPEHFRKPKFFRFRDSPIAGFWCSLSLALSTVHVQTPPRVPHRFTDCWIYACFGGDERDISTHILCARVRAYLGYRIFRKNQWAPKAMTSFLENNILTFFITLWIRV